MCLAKDIAGESPGLAGDITIYGKRDNIRLSGKRMDNGLPAISISTWLISLTLEYYYLLEVNDDLCGTWQGKDCHNKPCTNDHSNRIHRYHYIDTGTDR